MGKWREEESRGGRYREEQLYVRAIGGVMWKLNAVEASCLCVCEGDLNEITK